jgi:hypothetical protein
VAVREAGKAVLRIVLISVVMVSLMLLELFRPDVIAKMALILDKTLGRFAAWP